jgi:transcriptional regulator with XRE-family HTH domain
MSRKKYPTNENTLGGRLRSFRYASNFNTVQFSKLLGISQGSLSDIENNKTKPSSTPIDNLVHKTDINIYWLFTGEGSIYRQEKEKPPNDMDNDPEKVLKTSHTHGKPIVYEQQEHKQLEYIKEADAEFKGRKDLKISDLVAKTIDILESESIYRSALASNINAFYYSIQTRNTLEAMKNRMVAMEKQIAKLMENRDQQEREGKEDKTEKNIA